MGKHVTIYDVASHAGVSISTVSHTLNRPTRVQAATRKRVTDAIDQLGYIPKASAMELARKATGRVGVLAPFTSYASYMTRLAGVLDEASDHGFEVVVYDQESAAVSASPLLTSLPLARRVDGLLIMGLPLDDVLADHLHRESLPTVLIDSSHATFDSITIDDRLAGRTVAEHLIERKRTQIVYVSESQRSAAYLSQGQLRRTAFAMPSSRTGWTRPSSGTSQPRTTSRAAEPQPGRHSPTAANQTPSSPTTTSSRLGSSPSVAPWGSTCQVRSPSSASTTPTWRPPSGSQP